MILFTAIAYYIIRNIRVESKDMIDKMKLIAEGNFNINIKTDKTNEFGVMKNTLGETIDKVSDILKSIEEEALDIDNRAEQLSAISEEMTSSAENVANAIQEVAKGAGGQAEDLVDMTATLNHFGEQLDSITLAIGDVDDNSKQLGIMASENGENMAEIVSSLEELKGNFRNFADLILGLGNSINQINDIINLINNIADQTNLLALNTAIEAARAGESGKGFSVVAEEIRKLAEQTKESSENINKLIVDISSDTKIIVENANDMNLELEEQINNVDNSITAFGNMIYAIENINPQIESVNNSAGNIEEDKNNILEKVESTSSVGEEVSASTEEIAAASEEVNASSEEIAATAQVLSSIANGMTEKIKVFKLK